MIDASRQQELFDTLKAFNNSVVSIRLYPEGAPQITNAVDRGYKLLKQHLKHRETFTLGLRETDAELCGEIIPAETLQAISNLIVYRQLDLLELPRLMISPGLERANYTKLLDIFSAKVEQVKEEGGGRAFAIRLGLDGFFPEEGAETEKAIPEEQGETQSNAPKVPREYIQVLLGAGNDRDLISRVGQLMFDTDKGSVLLTAAIMAALQNGLKKTMFAAVPGLQDVLNRAASMVPDEKEEALAGKTVFLLLKHLNLRELTLLLSQQFVGGLGSLIGNGLFQQVRFDRFECVINALRQKHSQLTVTQTNESPQQVFVSGALARLMATQKGKQFLGQEKAKSILQAGEKNRRAKRVQASVKSLMQGNLEVLQSDEFCLHLPLVVKKLAEDGREKEVTAVLRLLVLNVDGYEGANRARLTGSLAGIGENLVQQERWGVVKVIAEPLLYWLNHSNEGDTTFEKVCFTLQALMNDCFKNDDFNLGDVILSTMYKIRSGVVKRPESVKAMVGRAQDRGIDRPLLALLLKTSLADPTDETLSRRIILQGPVASKYLVDFLIKADSSQDRFKLIDMLTYGNQGLPPILVEKLSEPMPWYGKRNILKLLADCGGPEHLEIVFQFLNNDDLRVQREAFVCLYKISGSKRKSSLLRVLHDSSETIKLQVVKALVGFGDAQVVNELAQLLEDHPYFSEEFRDTMLVEVCHSLARCQAQEAEKVLSKFLGQRDARQSRKIGDAVWQAAGEALAQVAEQQQREKARQAEVIKQRKHLLTRVNSAKIADAGQRSITGLAEERKIQKILKKEKDTDRVKIMLLELITTVARLKRFNQAEQLREWLIEVDPTALTEIIRAAEIIDEEKNAAIDDSHSELWAGLFDVLTGAEFKALYHSLVLKQYSSEELIVKRGKTQESLFFINSGQVKLFYREGGSEVLVKILKGGEIFGAGAFFEAAVSTLSAAAMEKVDIGVLKFEKLDKLKKEYPELDAKLQGFSRSFDDGLEFFKHSGKDRRKSQRFPVTGKVTTSLLDRNGQSTGMRSEGKLIDIAKGGASFTMELLNQDNSRLLLGRGIRLAFQTDDADGLVLLDGVVMAVRQQHAMESGYSVHVDFSEQLNPTDLQRILKHY